MGEEVKHEGRGELPASDRSPRKLAIAGRHAVAGVGECFDNTKGGSLQESV